MVHSRKPSLMRFRMASDLSKPTPMMPVLPEALMALPMPVVEPSLAPKMPTTPWVMKFSALDWLLAASPSQYWVSRMLKPVPSKAERKPPPA